MGLSLIFSLIRILISLIMFVYYGGHVLRGEAAPFLSVAPQQQM